jgi:hypothetical protein
VVSWVGEYECELGLGCVSVSWVLSCEGEGRV